MFDNWLAKTKDLQVEAYGSDPSLLSGDALADFITWNYTALVVELSEAMKEISWKTWATARGQMNREAFVEEMVDVLHFAANMIVAAGCTDWEFDSSYASKMTENRRRQTSTYDGHFERRNDNGSTTQGYVGSEALRLPLEEAPPVTS